MKNTIKLTMPFSFKGVEHKPSLVIDLDDFILGNQSLDGIFQFVASENKIGAYSYEYEVLESSPKLFSDPKGNACGFLSGDSFDFEGFKQCQDAAKVLNALDNIAKKTLKIDKLDEHEMIKQALLEAYEAGRDAG